MMAKRDAFRMVLLAGLLAPIQAEAAESEKYPTIQFDAVPLTVSIEGAESEGGPRTAAVSILAYNGGPLQVGNYPHPVYVDIDGIEGFGRPMPLLRDHDKQRIIGQVTATRKGSAIEANGKLVGASDDRREVEAMAADGYQWQASIGARPRQLEMVKPGKTASVNGRDVVGPVFIARKSRYAETSVVAIGADDEGTAVELELIAAEDDDGGNGGGAGGAGSGRQSPATFAAIKAERARREAIEAAAVRFVETGGDIEAIETHLQAAIADAEVSPTAFELELHRLSRPQGRIVSHSRERLTGRQLSQAVEASLQRHLGIDAELENHYPAEVLEACDRDPLLRHGLSLQDALLYACERNGAGRVSRYDVNAMLRGAFPSVNASGVSTFSLSGVFSNVANKRMRQAFDSVEQAWRGISAVESVSDFKTVTSYSLTGDMTYEKVAPTGELKAATIGEHSYTNQAETYGRLMGISRADIINDDLRALVQIPRRLGRGGALKLNDVFWAEFLAGHGAFFAAAFTPAGTGGNLIGSGSAAPFYLLADPEDLPAIETVFLNGRQVPTVEQTDADFAQLGIQMRGYHDFGVRKQEPRAICKSPNALDLDSLGAIYQLFLNQKDRDGKPLAIMPRILLVGTGNFVTANNIFNSTQIQSGTTGRALANNPFAGMFRVVMSQYLPNA